jgi:hypothetical protein
MAGNSSGRTRVTVQKNDNGRIVATFGYAIGSNPAARAIRPEIMTNEYHDLDEITVDFMMFTVLTHDKFQKLANQYT